MVKGRWVMFQQKQESQSDQVRSRQTGQETRFRMSLVIIVILCLLFSAALIVIIIILSNRGIITSSGLFISVVVPVLGLVISVITLIQSFTNNKIDTLENPAQPLPAILTTNIPQITTRDTTEVATTLKLETIHTSERLGRETSMIEDGQRSLHRVDWGEAPTGGNFYGRDNERAELEEWIIKGNCKLVAVLGIGGIGKSALAAKLVKD